jgi:hypothetical protein
MTDERGYLYLGIPIPLNNMSASQSAAELFLDL